MKFQNIFITKLMDVALPVVEKFPDEFKLTDEDINCVEHNKQCYSKHNIVKLVMTGGNPLHYHYIVKCKSPKNNKCNGYGVEYAWVNKKYEVVGQGDFKEDIMTYGNRWGETDYDDKIFIKIKNKQVVKYGMYYLDKLSAGYEITDDKFMLYSDHSKYNYVCLRSNQLNNFTDFYTENNHNCEIYNRYKNMLVYKGDVWYGLRHGKGDVYGKYGKIFSNQEFYHNNYKNMNKIKRIIEGILQ